VNLFSFICEGRFTVARPGRFERWFSDLVGDAPSLPSTDAEGRPVQ